MNYRQTLFDKMSPSKKRTCLICFGILLVSAFFIIGLIFTFLIDQIALRKLDAEALTLKETLTIPYGTPAKVSDFIADLKGELIEDFPLNTNVLGEVPVEFDYLNQKNRRRTATFSIQIVDDTKPLIYGKSAYALPKGYEGELTDLMISVDDLDDHPTRKISGTYDLNQPGEYDLEYIITDQSHNENRQPFSLTVYEPTPKDQNSQSQPPASSPEPKGLPIAEIIQDYKTPKTKIGIDVSRWQGKIDWSAVKAAGVEFAFIRLGYQTNFGAENQLDQFALKNLSDATKVGLPVGVYFYSYAQTTDEAHNQANWIIDQVQPYQLKLGIVFDWENWTDLSRANLSLNSLHSIADCFINTVSARGYHGSLYGSKNYLENFWQPTDHPTWVAQYYDKVTYDGEYWLWQISDQGQVSGINGFVDLDIMYLE